MKPTILVYCGEDGEAGKALAASLRDGNSYVVSCAASAFDVVQRHADRIVFTNDVSRGLRQKISAAHGLPDATPDGLQIAHCKMFQIKEILDRLASARTVVAMPKKKRGWPKGKPRKAA